MARPSTLERFLAKVRTGPDCWEWTAARHVFGYGKFYFDGRPRDAHRVSFLLFVGEIPEGLQVLHRCDNPPCVNPAHLFLGTQGDNVRDAVTKKRHAHSKRTHCAKGHEFTPDNTYVGRGGRRRTCKVCQREATRKYLQKKRSG